MFSNSAITYFFQDFFSTYSESYHISLGMKHIYVIMTVNCSREMGLRPWILSANFVDTVHCKRYLHKVYKIADYFWKVRDNKDQSKQ
jgi:hypothetical protein